MSLHAQGTSLIRICKCGNLVSNERLKALPATQICIACARKDDVPLTVGVMIWTHKTAPEIEIGTRLAKLEAGRKHSYGPHFRLGSKTGSNLQGQDCSTTMDERLLDVFEPVLVPRSRCHPERPRIGPSGSCLECSLQQQALRMKAFSR